MLLSDAERGHLRDVIEVTGGKIRGKDGAATTRFETHDSGFHDA
jgi:hypothetical protein